MDNWISVKEELPEIYKSVLIAEPPVNEGDDWNIQVSRYNGEKPRGEKYWYVWPDDQDEQPGSYYPSHWMPLPDPPKPSHNG